MTVNLKGGEESFEDVTTMEGYAEDLDVNEVFNQEFPQQDKCQVWILQ